MHRFIPKSVVCLREGYTTRRVASDVVAGLSVAVIALPLAMALGIASIPAGVAEDLRSLHPWLTPPAMGLYTAVVAGFLISLVGGSRVLIGGPTGAFIVIVFSIAERHGYAGLATATFMAGVMLIIMGVARLGAMIKFIPYPVTTGFTTGIAVVIAASQVREFLGLTITDAEGALASLPAEFVPKVRTLVVNLHSINWSATAVGVGALGGLILLRRFLPRAPGALVVVVLSAVAARALGLDVATIGGRFGDLPRTLPLPHLPWGGSSGISLDLVRSLIPEAATIALLAGVESLLAAVVADGMTGQRHKSDCELVGQGVANIGSAMFFGIPATGAIARTVANIKAGGRTPLAGIAHAVFLLLFMLALAPLAKEIPLAALSAVLLMVCWNMAEIDHFRSILRTPRGDVAVLLTTFALTVFVDLTVAVGVGLVLAALLFMKRMAEVANISAVTREFANDADARERDGGRPIKPPSGVEVFEIDGPFFFGVADRLKDTLAMFERPPRAFVLVMERVPHIDATGIHALEELHAKCRRGGTALFLVGVHAQPHVAFARSGLDLLIGVENLFGTLPDALAECEKRSPSPRPG
ncbi:MAG: STAS domain-containing protein [Phycisphaerae bacterium]|nr:STAS domain-containing protein [Phycisphaerae bacterium]